MTDNQYVNFLYWHGQTKQGTETSLYVSYKV